MVQKHDTDLRPTGKPAEKRVMILLQAVVIAVLLVSYLKYYHHFDFHCFVYEM